METITNEGQSLKLHRSWERHLKTRLSEPKTGRVATVIIEVSSGERGDDYRRDIVSLPGTVIRLLWASQMRANANITPGTAGPH